MYICVDVPLIRERQRQSRKFHWPLAEAKSTNRKTRRNSRDFMTGSAALANPAQMAEEDRWSKWRKKMFQRGICQAIARLL